MTKPTSCQPPSGFPVSGTVIGFFADDGPDADESFKELVRDMFAQRIPKPEETIRVRPVDGLGDVYVVFYELCEAA